MSAPLDIVFGWKHAETGTGSDWPTAPSTAEAAQGRNGFQRLFRETGPPGSGAFGGRPPAPCPAPVPGGPRPHQLPPTRDHGAHFDAVSEAKQTSTRAYGRPSRSGFLCLPSLANRPPR